MKKRNISEWYHQFCPFCWSWNEPTFFLRLIKVLGIIPMAIFWSSGSIIIFVIHYFLMFISYLIGKETSNKIIKKLCWFGFHKWEERGTVYDHPYAYAFYCKCCGDVKDKSHPHAKNNKYIK